MTREQEIANLKVIVEYEKQEYQRSIQKAPNEVKTVLGQIRDIHLKALEKQIPMKVKKIEKAGFGRMRRILVCPMCDVETYDDPYCRGCGQAIDWSK